ncbi:MAG: hypothetical protein ACK5XZ_05060 [Hyphomonadaceae bacterium]
MNRAILIGLGMVWMLTGVYIFARPMNFYEVTPGLKLMGPFNMHFISDVGLAFLASGGALTWGASTKTRNIAIAGITWPFLHALFHIQIWGHRGFPFDGIFAFDFALVITPAFLALALTTTLKEQSTCS